MADDPDVPSLADIVDIRTLEPITPTTNYYASTLNIPVTQHSMRNPSIFPESNNPEDYDAMKKMIENMDPEEKETVYKNIKKMAKKGELVQHLVSSMQLNNSILPHVQESISTNRE